MLVFLLLLSPALGELLSGSAPPATFFHPVRLALLVLFYGGGTLLIREARVRWQLQWPVLLLGLAYGVLEEGTMIQSFFNHNHADLAGLAHYGTWAGVQWPWAISVSFYHATISTLIPIAMADQLWPERRRQPVLGPRGLKWLGAGMGLVTVLLMVGVWQQQRGLADPYRPVPHLLAGSLLVVVALVALAWALRKSVVRVEALPLLPASLVGVFAFAAQTGNLVLPHALAEAGVGGATTVALQLGGGLATLLFVFFQLCHVRLTSRHVVALVGGSLLLFILLTPLHELVASFNPDPTQGMIAVGVVAAAGLGLWRWRAAAAQRRWRQAVVDGTALLRS